jgi:hypothetical protein
MFQYRSENRSARLQWLLAHTIQDVIVICNNTVYCVISYLFLTIIVLYYESYYCIGSKIRYINKSSVLVSVI